MGGSCPLRGRGLQKGEEYSSARLIEGKGESFRPKIGAYCPALRGVEGPRKKVEEIEQVVSTYENQTSQSERGGERGNNKKRPCGRKGTLSSGS